MNKNIYILIIGFCFIFTSLFFARSDKIYKVINVNSPTEIITDKTVFILPDLESFDSKFSIRNKEISNNLKISEEEAFILGNLGKYWTSNLLKNRFVYFKDNSDIVYLKFSYKEKFKYSGFCLKDRFPCYNEGFEKRLKEIRKTKYKVLNLDTDEVYDVDSPIVRNLENFLVIKKVHLPKKSLIKTEPKETSYKKPVADFGNIKIFFTDSTAKLKPDRNCNSSICREILTNINSAQKTIDMAIYGYSSTPEIEKALLNAQRRGVKIRLIYDSDQNGNNIYPDTETMKKLIPDNKSDISSDEAKNIMHNKFYIFDDKVLITGSANLSHTDMSGFNSNSMVVINSEEVAQIYKKEFEEMYNGKFHNSKAKYGSKTVNLAGTKIDIFFSPQDKCITNAVIPIINRAKEYIYIPTFLLTDKNVTAALISAKRRGVDVKIIIDALNASVQHTKHRELRAGNIKVKTENYAGKMHSKSMIVDDKYTIIGSMNFSYSGENKNDENLLVIENPDIAKAYKKFFLYQWDKIDNKWLKYNARAEGKDSIGSCSDGLDNNYDGLTDSADLLCR